MNEADLDYWSEKLLDAMCYTAPELIEMKLRIIVSNIEASVIHQQSARSEEKPQFHSMRGH